MRLERLWVFALVLAAACGGGGDTPATTAPVTNNPPAPGPPSTLTIQGGDQQLGEPGLPLGVRPSVLVRDAAGHPVPNVAVVYAIDTGGGTVAAASAVSGSDGIATSGTWTLGVNEGRQTLLASVTGVAPLRFAAMAVFPPAVVGTSTIGSAGGTLVVNRPGSPIDGLSVTVPDSALPQSAAMSVTIRSSAGITLPNPASAKLLHVASLPAATTSTSIAAALPLITLQVTGAQYATGDVSVRIPLPSGTTGSVMVAVLDSANRPVTFLPLLDADLTSVTVSIRAFDWHMYAAALSGSQPTPASNLSTQYVLTLAVFPVPRAGTTELGQAIPTPWKYAYQIGKHNFEFNDLGTAIAMRTDAGEILAEYASLYYLSAGIFNVYQRLPGVPRSNTRGIRLSAGLSLDWASVLGKYGPSYIYYWCLRDPAQWHWSVATSLYYTLWQNSYPLPLLLTDGTNSRMVLVVEWNPTGQYFVIRDPAYPNALASLGWTKAGMTPYVDPYDPSIRYTIPYFSTTILGTIWPKIWDGLGKLAPSAPLPYADLWPAERYDAHEKILDGARLFDADTLFMARDTTRIWSSMTNAKFGFPTTLPLAPGYLLQTTDAFQLNRATGQWAFNGALSGSTTFIDARVPGQTPTWYEGSIGFNLRKIESVAGATSWLSFRRLDIVKFGAETKMVKTGAQSAFFSVTQSGGPTLPKDARYEWNFGEGKPVEYHSSAEFQHFFPGPGQYAVTVRVLHAVNDLVLARVDTTYPPLSVAVTPAPLQASPGNVKTITAAFEGTAPPDVKYRWGYGDGTKYDTTTGPTTTHAWSSVNNYTITLDVLYAGRTLVSAPPVTAVVKVYPGAWRFTSVTVIGFSTKLSTFPSQWNAPLAAVDSLLDIVVKKPGMGMIFLEDGDLWKEHAVYLQIAPAGDPMNSTYWIPGSTITLLARASDIQFSRYNSTGTLKSGTIDGLGYVSYLQMAMLNSIQGTKTATQMTGTFTTAPYVFGGDRIYQFTATLVTP